MEIQLDFTATSCTMMSADGVLISVRANEGDVDVQIKLSVEQAADLSTEIQRHLLLLELKDV